MLTCDTLFFPNIDTTLIDRFQKRFFPFGAVMNPHITILRHRNSIQREVLVACVESTARSWLPFDIHLTGVDKSNPDGWLYLGVGEGKERIIALQKELYRCIQGQHRKRVCERPDPNVILGFFARNHAGRDAAYDEAINLCLSYRAVFDRITVTIFNSNTNKIVERLDFKLGLGP